MMTISSVQPTHNGLLHHLTHIPKTITQRELRAQNTEHTQLCQKAHAFVTLSWKLTLTVQHMYHIYTLTHTYQAWWERLKHLDTATASAAQWQTPELQAASDCTVSWLDTNRTGRVPWFPVIIFSWVLTNAALILASDGNVQQTSSQEGQTWDSTPPLSQFSQYVSGPATQWWPVATKHAT